MLLRLAILSLAVQLPLSAMAAKKVSLRKNAKLQSAIAKVVQTAKLNKADLAQLNLDAASDLVLINHAHRADGTEHMRFQQTINGVPVHGEHVIVNAKKGSHKVSGTMIQAQELKLKKSFAKTPAQALEAAKALVLGSEKMNTRVENAKSTRVVFIGADKKAQYAYATSFFAHKNGAPTRPFIVLDETLTKVLDQYEGLAHNETEEAVGPGGNEKTGKYFYGTDFEKLQTKKLSNGKCSFETENVKTSDMKHSSWGGSTAFSFECGENLHKEVNGAFSPLNDAHFFGGVIFRMYKEWFDSAPIRQKLLLRVHYKRSYENAFWNGSSMTFGDGKSRFYPLVSLDVVAHEVSHGFTEQNSGLAYREESGGMNEAFSDIAGEAAEYFMNQDNDFQVGGSIFKTEGKALRYFEDPTKDGKSIGHARNMRRGLNVHYSSGVYNRAFFLLTHTEGWDVKKAFAIFVKANQDYWTPNSTFNEGLCGLQSAATDLEFNAEDVTKAFDQVGVKCDA